MEYAWKSNKYLLIVRNASARICLPAGLPGRNKQRRKNMQNKSGDQAHMTGSWLNLPDERRLQLASEGWDFVAYEEFVAKGGSIAEGSEGTASVPEAVLIHGYDISTSHPLFGYMVHLWLHATGWLPGEVLLRPRHAQAVAQAIESAVRGRAAKSRVIETFVENDKVHVIGDSFGGITLCSNHVRASFGKSVALRIASELRHAAVAHLEVPEGLVA